MLTTRIPRADQRGDTTYQQRMIICNKDGSKTATIMHTVNAKGAVQPAATAGPGPLVAPAAGNAQAAQVNHSPRKKKNKNRRHSHSHQHQAPAHDGVPESESEYVDNDEDYAEAYDPSEGQPDGYNAVSDHDSLLDDDDYCQARNPSNESSRKKKKKKNKSKSSGGDAGGANDHHKHNDIWYKSDAEEKQRIREFWLQLGEEERRALVKLEKEAVLKKMKEQQKQTCSCSVCGRKRTVIEEELEILYDAYYEELENFANDQQSGGSRPPARRTCYVSSDEDDDDEDDDEDSDHSGNGSIFEFGSSLTVKGGILTVADDFLKNDGRKFLDLMEQLAERKLRQVDEEESNGGSGNGADWDDAYEDEDDDEYEDEEDPMTEEQRMEEGRRMFQTFAAKMFEQRVLTAYREKVARERQEKLLEELEEEERLKEMRDLNKQKNKEKKKQQKKAQKQQKEEERQILERKRQEEEEALKRERDRKLEAERLRKEAENARRAEEKAKKEKAERLKKEAERLRKEEEKRKQKEAEERKQRQREERERAEREERERKEKEERERKEKEERERKEREERERQEREQREKEERERKEKEEKERQRLQQLAQQQQQQKAAAESAAAAKLAAQRAAISSQPKIPPGPPLGRPMKVMSSARSPVPGQGPRGMIHQRPVGIPIQRPQHPSHQSSPMFHPGHKQSMPPHAGMSGIRPGMVPPQGYLQPQHRPHHPSFAVGGQAPPQQRPPHHHPQIAIGQHLVGHPPPVPMMPPGQSHPPPHQQQQQQLHANSVNVTSSAPPSVSTELKSASSDSGPLPIPSLFSANGLPGFQWPTTDGAPITTPAPSDASSGPSKVPIGASRPVGAVGAVGSSSAAPGAGKAVTRPAPIQRPTVQNGGADKPPSSAVPADDDDDNFVAGSSTLGGEILKDDERIGGRTSLKVSAPGKGGSAGGVPMPVGLDLPLGIGMGMGMQNGPTALSAGAVTSATRNMFDGPLALWDAAPHVMGGIGDVPSTLSSTTSIPLSNSSAPHRGPPHLQPAILAPMFQQGFLGGPGGSGQGFVPQPPPQQQQRPPAATQGGLPPPPPPSSAVGAGRPFMAGAQPVAVHGGGGSAWNGGRNRGDSDDPATTDKMLEAAIKAAARRSSNSHTACSPSPPSSSSLQCSRRWLRCRASTTTTCRAWTPASPSASSPSSCRRRTHSAAALLEEAPKKVHTVPPRVFAGAGANADYTSSTSPTSASPSKPNRPNKPPPLFTQPILSTSSDPSLNVVLFPKSSSAMQRPIIPLSEQAHPVAAGGIADRHMMQERVALIYATLHTGDIARAETVFKRAVTANRVVMAEMVDVGVVNAFVEAYVERGKGEKVMEWFGRMEELGVKPNVTTFALVIRYCLGVGDVELCKRMVGEMERAGVGLEELFVHEKFLEKEDREPLEAVLRDMGRDVEGIGQHDELLLSAMTEGQSQARPRRSEESSAAASAPARAFDVFDMVNQATSINPPKRIATAKPELKSSGTLGGRVLRSALEDLEKATATKTKYELQTWLEQRSEQAAEEERIGMTERLPDHLRTISNIPKDLVDGWHKSLVPLIKRELEELSTVSKYDTHEAYSFEPFLRLVTPEQLSKITITEFLRMPPRGKHEPDEGDREVEPGTRWGEIRVGRLVMGIGKAVEREHKLQEMKKKKNLRELRTELGIHQLHTEGRLYNLTMRNLMRKMAEKNKNIRWIPEWPPAIVAKVGGVLVAFMLKIAAIEVEYPDASQPEGYRRVVEPAFKRDLRSWKQKSVGVICYHQSLYELIGRSAVHVAGWNLPMIVPPKPWLTWNTGGYLTAREKMVRLIPGDQESKEYLEAADKANLLQTAMKALDYLGSIPWRINSEVFEVAAQCWNQGIHVSSLPAVIEMPEVVMEEGMKKVEYHQKRLARAQALANNLSQRCDANYKLEIARAFVGETVYFPHNLDFRGRAYPMPLHLNHIGNDLCRGLLLFDVAKPLGERGLRWLKIQVANLAGSDKISFADREAFVNRHLQDIQDSADKPLEGRRWWLQSEHPWQLLAACKELTAALRSGDPTQYLSRMPIHQDGTCNGLQHYAALGGDRIGAEQVNLISSDKPADIYTGVAQRVQKLVNADAANDVPEAILMQSRINRKLVKQTVMTNTYGVTFIGARRQVENRLREARAAEPDRSKHLTNDEIAKCSMYITRKIFDSMGEIFTGAGLIQKWLNETAKIISKSVPVDAIPQQQLEDSEQLAKMGLLPSVFTAMKAQQQADAEKASADAKAAGGEVAEVKEEEGLLGAAMLDDEEGGRDKEMDVDEFFEEEEEGEVEVQRPEATRELQPHEVIAEEDAMAAAAKRDKGKVEKMTSVIWVTPLGLPVVQPYRQTKTRQIKTLVQSITIRDDSRVSPVNGMKQSSAFPPNFIHSLDASHMMISALRCQKAGLHFAAVHDSFWTHACDVDQMATEIRDSFIHLHSQNLMGRLRDDFLERYGSHKVPVTVTVDGPHLKVWRAYLESMGRKVTFTERTKKRIVQAWVDFQCQELPPRGEFEIREVKNSTYFFH
ncbi:DNA-directed RNA polymerase [Borealophlyctis nickersoniae]|nr:DNA-directed RNA polymerase [Borealophlyctis nickersoniae]